MNLYWRSEIRRQRPPGGDYCLLTTIHSFLPLVRGVFEVAVARDFVPVVAEVEREALQLRLPVFALRAVLLPALLGVFAHADARVLQARNRLVVAAAPAP